jgi:lysophospholipase L1-like esterase
MHGRNWIMRRFWIVLVPVVVLIPAVILVLRASTSRTVNAPAYYLALGDSLTSAYGPNGATNPHGMARQFLGALQSHGVDSLVNLACAGETSASFIDGPCPVPKQVQGHYGKYPFGSSQLTAALTFIHDHPRQVKYVTIDIGNNDFDGADVSNGGCVYDGSGFPAALAVFDDNFHSILKQIKTALGSSGVLLAVNRYDAAANFCAKVPSWLKVFPTYNAHLAADAAMFEVPVADIYTAFGGPAAPNPKLCKLTYMCETPPDHHPNTAGHALIAHVLKATAGL